MRKFFILAAVVVSASAVAQSNLNAYFNSSLDASDPLWNRSTGGTPNQYYEVVPFWVATTGAYTYEMSSSVNFGALDTYGFIYRGSFDALSPLTNRIAFNDDFNGTLTVLPGPFAGITNLATGAGGNQPSSRMAGVNLDAGVQYWAVQSSWTAFETGQYFVGIGGGAGQVNLGLVPEPASMAALALGLAAVARRRRAKK
jgi:hypothetical protein